MSQSIATQTDHDYVDAPTPESVPPPPPAPKVEILTYSKAVQTEQWIGPRTGSAEDGFSGSEDEDGTHTSRANKRLSRRERERDEEIRESLRREIEEEVKAAKALTEGGAVPVTSQLRYPLRTLNDDELNAVTSSGEFLDFVERSSKVIERALDEDYDVLADYALGGLGIDEEDEEYAAGKRRDIKEVHHFWDERWSKKRMVSDLSFSPKVCYTNP
jgi:dynein intermediate chain